MIDVATVNEASLWSGSVQALWQSIRKSSLWIWTICIVILFALTPVSSRAQVGTADVLGTVTDSSGAVIPNAKVTIKDLDTAAVRVANTDGKGEYIFNSLPNGQYTLTVEMQGFKSYTIANLPLTVGARARYDAKLNTGAVTETVQVTGVAAVMQTDSSEVSSTVADTAVQDLPLNERNFASALQVQPGMSGGATNGTTSMSAGQNPEDRRPSFVIVANGQDDALNNQLIDGFDNNERNLGLSGVRPSIDGIAEVKVDTSSYSAEYGRAAGAVINVVTKGGANDFHGSLYEYFRNEIFNAYDYFDIKKPEYRLNSYGGSFGGPVWIPKLYNGRNKTFFFADWEQYRKVQGQAATALIVPTNAEFQSIINGDGLDLSDVLNGGNGLSCGSDNPGVACDGIKSDKNYVPAEDIDPVAKNYFLMMPLPNYPVSNPVNEYSNTPTETQNATNFDVRIDEHMGANDSLFGRFAYNPVTTIYPETIPEITSANATPAQKAAGLIGLYPGGSGGAGFPGPSKSTSYNTQIDYVHIFSPKLLLDLKTGYTRVNIASLPYNYNDGAAQKVGFASSVNTGGGLPNAGAWGPNEGSANSVPLVDINNTFQYAGSVTYTRGTHNLKIGGGLIRRQINAYSQSLNGGMFGFMNSSANGGPPFVSAPWWDARENFIAGYPGMVMRSNTIVNPGFRTWEIAGYVQDDWRASGKLTINLGVRYDIFTPFTEAHGDYSNFLMSCITSGTIGANCFVTGHQNARLDVQTDYKDIAPRVGFAYSMNPATVLRGGFGMSYFPPDVGETSSGGGPPSAVMQNYNPPYSFNLADMGFTSWGPNCTITNAAGGTNGCFDYGAPAPTMADLGTFNFNPQVTTVSAKPLNIHSAYVEMTNLALQRQFGARNTITLAYVGEFGRGLLRTVNADQPAPPGASFTPPGGNPRYTLPYVYPQLTHVTAINYYYNGAMNSYNAMQVVYARSLTKGFTVNANYTWSHNMSDATNLENDSLYAGPATLDFGNSFMDLRHRFAGTASYELPFGKNTKGLESALIKGWKFNEIGYWETGSPFTVGANLPNTYVPSVSSGRADQIGNPNSGPKGLKNWFNTAAFADPPAGRQGTEMVNQVLGPHQRDFDLSLNKDFNVVEKLKAQFRAECFNISNTPNFAAPSSSKTGRGGSPNPQYNQITSTMFGANPRQFQFALKLLF